MATDAHNAVPTATLDRWFGVNQYDTAVDVARRTVNGGWMKWDGAGFANGASFSDALSAAPTQGVAGSVLLLTPGTSLAPVVSAELALHKSSIYSVTYFGGTAVLSQTVRDQVIAALH